MATLFTRQNAMPCKVASLTDISDHDWNLEPNLYVGNSVSVVEGTRLGDIAKIRRGGTKKGALYNPWKSTANAITLFCDASSFTYGQVISENDLHTQFEYDPEQHARCAIPSEKYCILIGRIGTPFKVGLKLGAKSDENAPFVKKYLLASDSLLLLVPSDDINPYYLLAFFCTDVGQKLLEQVASGTVTQLSTRNLREVRVPIPSTDEQKAIEKQYRAWLQEKQRLSTELEELEQSRRNPEWLDIHRNGAVTHETKALKKAFADEASESLAYPSEVVRAGHTHGLPHMASAADFGLATNEENASAQALDAFRAIRKESKKNFPKGMPLEAYLLKAMQLYPEQRQLGSI